MLENFNIEIELPEDYFHFVGNNFLKELKEILNLDENFVFCRNTEKKYSNFNLKQIEKVKSLCKSYSKDIDLINKEFTGSNFDINWFHNVVKLYFDI